MIAIAATLGGAVMGVPLLPHFRYHHHGLHRRSVLPPEPRGHSDAYAVTVAAVAFVNYIIAGQIQNVVIDLIIAVVSMVAVLLIIGKLNHS